MEILDGGIYPGYFLSILISFIQLMFFPCGLLVVLIIALTNKEKSISVLILVSSISLFVSRIPVFLLAGLGVISTEEYARYARYTEILWYVGTLGVLTVMILMALKLRKNSEAAAVGDADR